MGAPERIRFRVERSVEAERQWRPDDIRQGVNVGLDQVGITVEAEKRYGMTTDNGPRTTGNDRGCELNCLTRRRGDRGGGPRFQFSVFPRFCFVLQAVVAERQWRHYHEFRTGRIGESSVGRTVVAERR